jgi:hypothetical protein
MTVLKVSHKNTTGFSFLTLEGPEIAVKTAFHMVTPEIISFYDHP